MPDNPTSLSAKLQTEGEKVRGFFAGLTADQWQSPIYAESSIWTPRSILAHLVTAERSFLKLFEKVRQGEGGVSEEFSIDRFNASQQEKMRDQTPADLLAQYAVIRKEMTAYVAALSEADLSVSGRHPAMGMSNLGEMIKMLYIHNNMHVRDIKRTLFIS
jgi:hypothetical protein